jgi:hypothetical protein
LILHEGKTFHQYTDSWDSKPRYSVTPDDLKPMIAEATRHYRLVFRDIARSNDERTMIAFIAPPGVVFGHTATVEKAPWARTNADALVLCALFNAFPFDWLVRQKAATHLSLYILDALPVPRFNDAGRHFLAHAALRLSCNHAGYAALWREQLNRGARHCEKRGTCHCEKRSNKCHCEKRSDEAISRSVTPWPVLPRRSAPRNDTGAGPGDRLNQPGTDIIRAQVDAVVAHAYGLDREQYDHILRSFSHRSHPDAPALCLAAFDELKARGLSKFCRQHDPFADGPLVTARAGPST